MASSNEKQLELNKSIFSSYYNFKLLQYKSSSVINQGAKKLNDDIINFLDLGADINYIHLWCTMLHHASRYGLLNIVKILLERGADPNILDNHGETPLMGLIHNIKKENMVGVVKELIYYGSDIYNIKEHMYGYSFYEMLSHCKNKDNVKEIIAFIDSFNKDVKPCKR
jgi:hypothetical protein